MSPDSIHLRQKIAKIENKYPDDNLITTYKDFLKERPFLLYYKFNPKVFHTILKIGIESLENKSKAGKISLITQLYKYLELAKENQELPKDTASLLIRLFNYLHTNPVKNFIMQQRLAGKITRMLRGLPLKNEEIIYLISLVDSYRSVLIYILRYTYKSSVITSWANDNFLADRYREYRTELISWLIDEDPGYEIDAQVLKDDFEFANEKDRKAIQEFKDEVDAINIVGKTIIKVFPETEDPSFFGDDGPYTRYRPRLPELILTKRNYPVPIDGKEEEGYYPFKYIYDYQSKVYRAQRVYIPSFKSLESWFSENIDEVYRKTMIYAIMFSRWGIHEKISLLEKYYSKDWFFTFDYIAVQIKSIEMLKWLIKKE